MQLQSLNRTEWRRLATSGGLEPNDIDFLAETNDVPTAAALTRNNAVRLTVHAMRALAEIGKYNSAIARDLARRPEVSDTIARTLYPFVPEDVKAQLRTYFSVETATSFPDQEGASYLPGENVVRAAEQFARHGMLEPVVILKALSFGHLSTFIAFFAAYTGLTPRDAQEGWREASPRAMAVVCRAKSFSRDDFKHLYLLTSRLRGAGQPVDQRDLREALRYFDRVDPAVAARMLRWFQQASPATTSAGSSRLRGA